jgi:hypothetical protein
MVINQIKLFTLLIEGISFSGSRARAIKVFFFLDNHREYIENAIKPTAKVMKLS